MTKRDEVVDNALWGVENEPDIHYTQGAARFAALNDPRMLPLNTDCSAFFTLCCKWAEVPDPNGYNYNGLGFTGTLLNNMDEIPLEEAKLGDAIVYGPGTGDHVVMVINTMNKADPLVVSHGQERGPVKVRHSVEVRSHRAPVRVLRLAGADEEELTMEQAVADRFKAVELEIKELRNHLLGGEGVRGVEEIVNHIEKMLSSDIAVDNKTLKTLTDAVAAMKDDLTALRNAAVGPPPNA